VCYRTLCEKLCVSLDKLARHGSCGELGQGIALIAILGADGNLLDLVDGHLHCSPQTLDDDLGADTLLDMLLDLFENLSG
jgi:hypothetical protein